MVKENMMRILIVCTTLSPAEVFPNEYTRIIKMTTVVVAPVSVVKKDQLYINKFLYLLIP